MVILIKLEYFNTGKMKDNCAFILEIEQNGQRHAVSKMVTKYDLRHVPVSLDISDLLSKMWHTVPLTQGQHSALKCLTHRFTYLLSVTQFGELINQDKISDTYLVCKGEIV